jgi:N-acetylmuramoyl-L-alanine amidase
VKLEEDRSRYANMTEESFIVASMAQSSFVRWSERFAALVQQEVTHRVPTLKNNGVSQAGFIVLIGASMPNILIETGYISNPKEEKFLGSKSGQTSLAEGIFDAVEKYKQEYERSIAR